MKLNKIYHGDCLEVMKTLPKNCVDSVVTDPPYGIGFMGKAWDTFKPELVKKTTEYNETKRPKTKPTGGKTAFQESSIAGTYDRSKEGILAYQKFCEDWGRECLRVLKPGGHLMASCSTRMYQRLACGLEDAGFEIRDMIAWVYGCLSEDTEILTINGWERYHKDIVNNPVLCYDIDNNSFEFHKPKRDFIYENKHTAYRIKSDKTNQVVSRNHRVLVERGGRKVFVEAEALERQENIPFLESLPDLSKAISDYYKRTGDKKQKLPKMLSENGWEMEQGEVQNLRTYLSNLSKEIQAKVEKQKIKVLFPKLCWKGKRLVKKCWTLRQKKLETRKRTGIKRKNDGKNKSCLEGWSNLFQKARQLCSDKICQMSTRLFGNGSQRRLCYGTSLDNGSVVGQVFNSAGMCSSHQSQSTRQSAGKPNAIPDQQSPQITRSTITPIEYRGKVWCVEVPTGAFVARRNGKIFITGNSGFPKSLNVGKSIDKLQGNEREVVGVSEGKGYSSQQEKNKEQGFRPYEKGLPHEHADRTLTKGTSKWEGWGTALKPALEPICVARKPLSEKTVAKNVLKWGTGGINIDGCRVKTQDRLQVLHNKTNEKDLMGNMKGKDAKGRSIEFVDSGLGRFPANLIHDGSDEVVRGFPQTGKSSGGKSGHTGAYSGGYKEEFYGDKKPGFGDSGSASRFFYCAKASKSERNRGCEGMPLGEPPSSARSKPAEGRKNALGNPRANNHPTVKPLKLMQYLVRLVTPPKGICLDPFLGSGTTAMACIKEGFRYIGIEKEEDYIKIARARIKAVVKQEVLL